MSEAESVVRLRAIHAQPRNRPVALQQHLGHVFKLKVGGVKETGNAHAVVPDRVADWVPADTPLRRMTRRPRPTLVFAVTNQRVKETTNDVREMGNIQSRQARDRRRRNTAASHYPVSNLAATSRRLDGLLPAKSKGHEVTITGTETHPDKIEAVAHPAEVEDVLGKLDSAIETANKYVEKVVHSAAAS